MSHRFTKVGMPHDVSRPAMVSSVPLLRMMLLFVLASLADLGFTIHMIQLPAGSFYESNPIAAWVLFTWGIEGMTAYKLGLVFLVCLIACAIAMQRRDVAQRLLSSAAIIVSSVLFYSLVLYVGASGQEDLIAHLE